MAVYRFKISFEDYDDIVREIDIRSNQTFEDLHRALHLSTGYQVDKSSSFYVSNDHWIKKEEIAYLPSQRKIEKGVAMMTNAKLNKFIDDPHQKFYYIYNFDKPFEFHVELIKILLNEEVGREYPYIVRRIGEAPKIIDVTASTATTIITNTSSEEFDFLNEIGFNMEDAEEIESMNEMGINTEEDDEDENEDGTNEFLDEEEGYDDRSESHKDDY